MKKSVIFIVLMAALALSAYAQDEPVVVTGTVYGADNVTEVSGASISATCNGTTKTTSTDSSGDYFLDFSDTNCTLGSTVTVTATNNGASGTASDTVKDFNILHVAIVNVFIPEFTTVAAMVALLGASTVFFVFRRR